MIARSWVASQRDLPLILSRDVVAVTDETVKRPLPFVRSREMHVQEALVKWTQIELPFR